MTSDYNGRSRPTEGKARLMEFTYQSPLSEAVGLRHQELPSGMSLWSYQGIAVAMAPFKTGWPKPLTAWYIARRDANLMGACPVCKARWPLVTRPGGVQYGTMDHDAGCVLVDAAFVEAMLGRMLA